MTYVAKLQGEVQELRQLLNYIVQNANTQALPAEVLDKVVAHLKAHEQRIPESWLIRP